MKPCTRWLRWFSANWLALKTGVIAPLLTLVLTSVSIAHGSTSLRSGRGLNGLLGLCTPAPVPAGNVLDVDLAGAVPGMGELSCAFAIAATQTDSAMTVCLMFMLHAAVFANGQTFASGLQFFVASGFVFFGF